MYIKNKQNNNNNNTTDEWMLEGGGVEVEVEVNLLASNGETSRA